VKRLSNNLHLESNLQLSKHLEPSRHLSALHQQTMSISTTIMLTMDNLQSLPLSMTSAARDKLYLSVKWVLTTKTEWLRGASESFRTAQGPYSFTPTEDGPTPSVSTCGHMHYAMPQISEMPPPMKRERRPLLQPLLGLKEPRLTSFHPFGCPVCVLDARMQPRQKIPK
jgi:hypothetical protein